MRTQKTVQAVLDDILAQMSKRAESSSEQGRVENQGDSGTTHPSKDVSDGSIPATTGARAAENEKDVKKNVPGQPVDEAKEDKMEGASKNPLTDAAFTGEDPSVESASAKPKFDGSADENSQGKKTTSPATSTFGDKYAAVAARASALISDINDQLAKYASLGKDSVQTETPNTTPAKSEPVKAAQTEVKDEAKQAAEAGANAAELAVSGVVDQVVNPAASELIFTCAKQAAEDARMLREFYQGLNDSNNERTTPVATTGKKAAVNKSAALKQAGVNNFVQAIDILNKKANDAAMQADLMAGGGQGVEGVEQEAPEAEGGGGGGEDAEIAALLEQLGISPEELANIPPEELAALLEQLSAGGGGEGEVIPAEAMAGGGGEVSEAPMIPAQ